MGIEMGLCECLNIGYLAVKYSFNAADEARCISIFYLARVDSLCISKHQDLRICNNLSADISKPLQNGAWLIWPLWRGKKKQKWTLFYILSKINPVIPVNPHEIYYVLRPLTLSFLMKTFNLGISSQYLFIKVGKLNCYRTSACL